MAKNTMGTKLPRKLEQKMQIVGEQIKLARLRRNLSVAQVAERATCSPLTAVSYTHLDVYKRQIVNFSIINYFSLIMLVTDFK